MKSSPPNVTVVALDPFASVGVTFPGLQRVVLDRCADTLDPAGE